RLERAFAALVDDLGQQGPPGAALVDRSAYEVLFRFFRSAVKARQGKEDGSTAGRAVRWLSGQALDIDEARPLGLWPGRQRDQPSASDRLAHFDLRLRRLTGPEPLALVRSRLHHFMAPFERLEPVRLQLEEGPLFPLGQGWYARFLEGKADVRPRDVINWARE